MRPVPFLIGTLTVLCIPLSAETLLSYADYEKRLSDALEKDRVFREQIAQEQALIIDYKAQLLEHKKNVQDLRQKKFEILGISPDYIKVFGVELDSLKSQAVAISELGDADLLLTEVHLETLIALKDSLGGVPAVKLPLLKKKLAAASEILNKTLERIVALKARPAEVPVAEKQIVLPSAVAAPSPEITSDTRYTVSSRSGKPETLYEIASKMYGDPYKWPRIYHANKKLLDKNFTRFIKKGTSKSIADPSDLILPGQVLLIPRD